MRRFLWWVLGIDEAVECALKKRVDQVEAVTNAILNDRASGVGCIGGRVSHAYGKWSATEHNIRGKDADTISGKALYMKRQCLACGDVETKMKRISLHEAESSKKGKV